MSVLPSLHQALRSSRTFNANLARILRRLLSIYLFSAKTVVAPPASRNPQYRSAPPPASAPPPPSPGYYYGQQPTAQYPAYQPVGQYPQQQYAYPNYAYNNSTIYVANDSLNYAGDYSANYAGNNSAGVNDGDEGEGEIAASGEKVARYVDGGDRRSPQCRIDFFFILHLYALYVDTLRFGRIRSKQRRRNAKQH